MDYSLQTLNTIANFKNIKLNDFVDQLNLIGLEVDNISNEKVLTNTFLDELTLLVKIPADRDDLLNKRFFFNELSVLLSFDFYELWKILKLRYFLILKKNFKIYSSYSYVKITSKIDSVFIYLIEIKNFKNTTSPSWLLNKLEKSEQKVSTNTNIHNIFNLLSQEWGQEYSFYSMNSDSMEKNLPLRFELEYFTENEAKITDIKQDFLNRGRTAGKFVLRNKDNNEILLPVQKDFFLLNDDTSIENHRFFIQTIFYNYQKNNLLVNRYDKDVRKIFIENFKFSFQRLLTLFQLLTFSRLVPEIYSFKGTEISLKVNKILKLKKKKLLQILNIKNYSSFYSDFFTRENPGIKLICETKVDFYFQVSSLRRDLIREIDLIEEYSKFIGYKNFNEIIPKKEKRIYKKKINVNNYIKNFFLNYNFSEVITNSILEPQKASKSSIQIQNPLNIELSTLRQSLIPKLLTISEKNINTGSQSMNFFEIGRVFKSTDNKYLEEDKLAGIFQVFSSDGSSLNKPSSMEWFIQRAFLENFLYNFNYKDLVFLKIPSSISTIHLFHPTRSVLIFDKKKFLGVFGQMNPTLEQLSSIKKAFYGFEFNLKYFKQWRINKKVYCFTEYSKYPIIIKDISINIHKESNFNQLKKLISDKSKYLKNISIFDIYFDEKLADTVNVGIRLEFQSKNETLLSEKIEKEVELIKNFLLLNISYDYNKNKK